MSAPTAQFPAETDASGAFIRQRYPSRIVPLGPIVDWLAPHDRARLG